MNNNSKPVLMAKIAVAVLIFVGTIGFVLFETWLKIAALLKYLGAE